jgi:predicted nucleic acid-binding Zn ribbon protein
MPITKLSTSIENVLKNKNFGLSLLLGKLQNEWEKIVGSNINGATKITDIKNKTIYIKCKNPTWKNELFYQKNELLKKIQKNSPKNTINKIHLI